jgi:hypothetical protein
MDTHVIIMSAPHPSNPVQHFPELCTVCAARLRRHQARNDSVTSETTITNRLSRSEDIVEAQIAANKISYNSPPPPPYSKRRRYQRLDVDPPTYTNVITSPPPGVNTTTLPVTVRYTEIIILEDDGYAKVVCPTARKFRSNIKVYDSMDWNRFWECLRQLKPSLTSQENALKEVKGLRRKGKWERVLCTRFGGVRLDEENWEETRKEMCSGDVNKVVVMV